MYDVEAVANVEAANGLMGDASCDPIGDINVDSKALFHNAYRAATPLGEKPIKATIAFGVSYTTKISEIFLGGALKN